jgi:hypothetical protein
VAIVTSCTKLLWCKQGARTGSFEGAYLIDQKRMLLCICAVLTKNWLIRFKCSLAAGNNNCSSGFRPEFKP